MARGDKKTDGTTDTAEVETNSTENVEQPAALNDATETTGDPPKAKMTPEEEAEFHKLLAAEKAADKQQVEPEGPHYLVLEPFTAFGTTFKAGDKLHGHEEWPEGTIERRVENKFIVFKAG